MILIPHAITPITIAKLIHVVLSNKLMIYINTGTKTPRLLDIKNITKLI